MEEQRRKYPVVRLCKVMGVSRSGYYAWRERANQELGELIREVHRVSGETYGGPRFAGS